jgi:hypothetical protein
MASVKRVEHRSLKILSPVFVKDTKVFCLPLVLELEIFRTTPIHWHTHTLKRHLTVWYHQIFPISPTYHLLCNIEKKENRETGPINPRKRERKAVGKFPLTYHSELR